MRGSLGTAMVPVPPPSESGLNIGVPRTGNGDVFESVALALNIVDAAFAAATATVSW